MYNGQFRGEYMLDSKTKWILKNKAQNITKELLHSMNVSPITLELLIQRGITTEDDINRFLEPRLNDLYEPNLLSMIEVASERIHRAIQHEEKILVYGDYDADGVSATTLLLKVLNELGANCDYYIPNRFTEGYGLNEQALRTACENGFQVVITVDTGIGSHHEAMIAKQLGIDLIITDHHESQDELPDAYAIIHPKCSSNYPFKELAGVGVAFKLAEYLLGYFPEQYLDLVAIGTIADLVPLIEENRILTYYGLRTLSSSKNKGIKALKQMCQIDGQVSEEDVAFSLAPRINAVGRLQDASLAVRLLMTESTKEARELAETVQSLNSERQKIVQDIFKEAEQIIHSDVVQDFIIVAKKGWNEGVLGIVASQLVRKYDRPTIVLTIKEDTNEMKGSGRSIPAFDLFENAMNIRDLFTNFGGHSQAAGMTFPMENLPLIQIKLNEMIKEQLTEEDFKQVIEVSREINVDELNEKLIHEINQLAPFGMGNAKPNFLLKDTPSDVRQIGREKNHLKLQFQANDDILEGIGFGMGDIYPFITPHTPLSIVGDLNINEWNGYRTVQIVIQDVQIDERQLFDHRGKKNVDISPFIIGEAHQLIVSNELITQEDLSGIEQITYKDSLHTLSEVDTLFIFDLPNDLDELKTIVQMTKPKNIHACYYVENSTYLTPFPSREEFKWLYGLFARHQLIDLNKNIDAIQRAKNWSKDMIIFMTKVFSELKFVKIDEGIVSLNPQPIKKDLQDSKVYQKRQHQVDIEKRLYYSSYHQLKTWFMNCIDLDMTKEEVIDGL